MTLKLTNTKDCIRSRDGATDEMTASSLILSHFIQLSGIGRQRETDSEGQREALNERRCDAEGQWQVNERPVEELPSDERSVE